MTLITATTRLARELRRQHDREQLAAGLRIWPTPEILPFQTWLGELWRAWSYSDGAGGTLRLLRPLEERAIWEDIVRADGENLLLAVRTTAEAALKAWTLLCEWALPLNAPDWNDSTDSAVFHGWALEFRRRLDQNGWLSNGELAAFVADRIGDGGIQPPPHVEIAGFLELAPLQKRLFDRLAASGTSVRERDVSKTPGAACRIALADTDQEIRAAAGWARRILQTDTNAVGAQRRVGVVVANLEGCRSQADRIFSETFHPEGRLRPDRDSHRLFNISLGPRFVEHPIIEAAFMILNLELADCPIEMLGRLLRSPFIQGAHAEWTARAQLDVALRSCGDREVSLESLLSMAGTETAPYHCPQLHAQLVRWSSAWPPTQRQLPSDWAASLSALLESVGWPGDGPLDSVRFQTLEKWNELLSDFAGLDGVLGPMGLAAAVRTLEDVASSLQFQPESDPAPVQILGLFEASGLVFDHLWIMGMHDGVWPGPSSPDPFLPYRLQRRLNLPRSSPGRELEFAQTLTARLLSSAPAIVASHPEREDDRDLRISPLFRGLPEVKPQDLGLVDTERYVRALWKSRRIERLADNKGPSLKRAFAEGGTSLFKLQSICPFKAFAELRLGATQLDQPQPGLSALDRGLLIHRVLRRIWEAIGSHANLVSIDDKGLASKVRTGVEAELEDLGKRRRALGGRRFRGIEQARLERVTIQWLKLERERQPFSVVQQEHGNRATLGGIDLSIRADRVDRLDDGARVVIDYKTGECNPSDWEGERPDEPQLPIYAVTAAPPLVGVFYGRLKTGEVAFRGVTDSEGLVPGVKHSSEEISLKQRMDQWREVLDRLGKEFREGRAAVDPKQPSKTCQHCALPTLCRIGQAQFSGGVQGESADA